MFVLKKFCCVVMSAIMCFSLVYTNCQNLSEASRSNRPGHSKMTGAKSKRAAKEIFNSKSGRSTKKNKNANKNKKNRRGDRRPLYDVEYNGIYR